MTKRKVVKRRSRVPRVKLRYDPIDRALVRRWINGDWPTVEAPHGEIVIDDAMKDLLDRQLRAMQSRNYEPDAAWLRDHFDYALETPK